MKYEIVNKETSAMKQLISGIREVNKRLRVIAKTLRQVFGGETYLTGREVSELLFINPAPCRIIWIRTLSPTPKLQVKYSIGTSISTAYCKKTIILSIQKVKVRRENR